MSPLPVDIDTETIQFDGRWLGREDLAKAIRSLLDSGNYNIGRHSAALEALNAALVDVRTMAFRVTPEQAEAVTQAAARSGRTPGAIIRDALAQFLGSSTQKPAMAIPEPAHAHAHVGLPAVQLPAQQKKAAPEGRRPTDPELPVVSDVLSSAPAAPSMAAATPPVLGPEPKTPPTPPPGLKPANPAVLAGPGALRAAGLPPAAGSVSPSVVVDQSLATGAEVVTEAATPEEAAAAVDLKPKAKPEPEQDAVERRWFGG